MNRVIRPFNFIFKGSATSNWMLFSSVVSALGGFAFWKLATNTVSPTSLAPILVLNSMLPLITIIGSLGLPEGVIRFAPKHFLQKSNFLLPLLLINLAATTLVAAIVVITFRIANPIPSWPLIISILIITIPATLSSLVDANNVSQRRGRLIFQAAIGSTLAKIVVMLVLPTHIGVYWAISFSAWVGFLVSASSVFRHFELSSSNALNLKDLIQFTVVNWISASCSVVTASLMPYFIFTRLGRDEAATIAILLMLVSAFAVPPSILSRAYLAEASNSPWNHRVILKKKLATAFVLVGVPTIWVLMLGNQLLALFGASYLASGSESLRVFALASIVSVANYFIDAQLNFRKRKISFLLVNIFGSACLFVFTLWAVEGGLVLISMAWLFAQLAYFIFGFCVLMRK